MLELTRIFLLIFCSEEKTLYRGWRKLRYTAVWTQKLVYENEALRKSVRESLTEKNVISNFESFVLRKT